MESLLVLVLTAAPLDLSSLGDGSTLPELVWRQSPDLHDVRAAAAVAVASREKALRLPNPGLDVSLNTIPVGASNPVDLREPLLNTPNVAVGLSMLLEIGKRGPRQDATAEAATAAAWDAVEALRQKVFDVEDVIGDVAAAQVRVETLKALAEDAKRLAVLQAARARTGDTAALDADRAKLEEEGALASAASAEGDLAAQLRGCGALIGAPCLPFANVTQAKAWLDARVDQAATPLDARPDVRALDARARSARSSQTLAEHTWMPDPTVRVGYVRDQFVVSGNQLNSLFIGVSMPLPLFDRGQDDAKAAAAVMTSANDERARRLASAEVQLERLIQEAQRAEARQRRLAEETVPLAQGVVLRLDAAVSRGAAPLQDLVFARRTLSQLMLDASELDRVVFHLHVARARLTRALPLLGALQ